MQYKEAFHDYLLIHPCTATYELELEESQTEMMMSVFAECPLRGVEHKYSHW